MRCRIRELVEVAREHGNASASNGRWKAWYVDNATYPDGVLVQHFETYVLYVDSNDFAVGLNEGWRSQTDKQGINQILRYTQVRQNLPTVQTYDGLFPEHVDDTPIKQRIEAELDTSEPEPVEVFVPPIRSQDTVGIG